MTVFGRLQPRARTAKSSAFAGAAFLAALAVGGLVVGLIVVDMPKKSVLVAFLFSTVVVALSLPTLFPWVFTRALPLLFVGYVCFVQNLEIAKVCIAPRKRLIQYSSAEVYGKTAEGAAYVEDATDGVFGPVHKQRWIYAIGKMLLERVLYAHGIVGNLEFTIIRPFNFIGSRIDYLVPANSIGGPRVFPHFMSALLTGGPIRLVDGGYARRAFMHIDDANRAFQTILDQPEATRNRIFNVGNPDNDLSIRELAYLMMSLYEELTGRKPTSELVTISGEAFYGPGYEDSSRLPPDVSKIQALGWVPRHDAKATFLDAMRYYLCDERVGSRTEVA